MTLTGKLFLLGDKLKKNMDSGDSSFWDPTAQRTGMMEIHHSGIPQHSVLGCWRVITLGSHSTAS